MAAVSVITFVIALDKSVLVSLSLALKHLSSGGVEHVLASDTPCASLHSSRGILALDHYVYGDEGSLYERNFFDS